MKDKSSFRLISIGFVSGIVFSGLLLLTINIIRGDQVRFSIPVNATVVSSGINKGIPEPSSEKIDLNQATLTQLETLPGIGETKANAIIEFRNKYGAFEDISELSYVPGIGNTLRNASKENVTLG